MRSYGSPSGRGGSIEHRSKNSGINDLTSRFGSWSPRARAASPAASGLHRHGDVFLRQGLPMFSLKMTNNISLVPHQVLGSAMQGAVHRERERERERD